MSKKRTLALLPFVVTCVAALNGCTVGPDYVTPDLGAITKSRWSESAEAASTSPSLGSWWSLLQDEELTRLVEEALVANLDVEEAYERVVAARARRGIENAARLPTVDGTGSYERLATGQDGLALGGAPGGSRTNIFALGAQSGWELDLFGRVARRLEAADAEIEFAVFDHRAARVALAGDVAREVILIRSLDAESELLRAAIANDDDVLSIVRARQSAGLTNALDVARAQRVLEVDSAALPEVLGERRAAELRIAVLLGQPPEGTHVETAPLPRRDVIPALGVPAELLIRRPDVRRAERSVASATALIGAAMADRYPRISLSGSLSLQGAEPSSIVNPLAHVVRFGPSISFPLFDGGRGEADVLVRESEQRQAVLRLKKALLNAFAEVEEAAFRRKTSAKRSARLAGAETAARDTEALARDRYGVGAVTFLEVSDAITQRLAIARDRLRAERDELLRLVDLYVALGGGWDPTAPPALP